MSINVWSAACAAVIALVGDLVGYVLLSMQGQKGQAVKMKEEPMKFGAASGGGREGKKGL